ncbi:TPA: hypothetical protein ACVWSQ_003178, partial [Legionella anisa]
LEGNTKGVSLYQCSVFAKFLHGVSVSICPTPSPQPSSPEEQYLTIQIPCAGEGADRSKIK